MTNNITIGGGALLAGLDRISDRYLSACDRVRVGSNIMVRSGRGTRVAIVTRLTEGGMIEAKTYDRRGFHAPKVVDPFDFVGVLSDD